MTSEYLLDAMGLLDDDMIQDAEEGAKPAFHWQRWGGVGRLSGSGSGSWLWRLSVRSRPRWKQR